MHVESTLKTADGLTLFAQSWLPADETRAALIVCHGLAEHSGRYRHLAEYLNGRQIAVYAFDGRSHGRSEGKNGLIRSFDRYLQDVDLFVERVRSQIGVRPLFLFGHSMGGTVAALWTITRQPDLAGLLLSAPGLVPGSEISPLLMKVAPLLGRLAPRLPTQKLDSSALSRDPAVVRAYDEDPACYRGGILARTGAELLQALLQIQASMEAVRVPLYIMHGTADRLTNLEGSRLLYSRAAAPDKTLKLYEGFYHELLNEPEKEKVMVDIAGWLEAHL